MSREQREAQVVELYKAGQTLKEISSSTGVASGTVWNILHRNKVEMRPACRRRSKDPYEVRRKKHPRFSKEEHQEMVHLYTNVNKTMEELGLIYGCSRSSIRTWLAKANVVLRAPARRKTYAGYIPNPRKPVVTEEQIQEAVADRKMGMTWKELSDHYKVSMSHLRRKVLARM